MLLSGFVSPIVGIFLVIEGAVAPINLSLYKPLSDFDRSLTIAFVIISVKRENICFGRNIFFADVGERLKEIRKMKIAKT